MTVRYSMEGKRQLEAHPRYFIDRHGDVYYTLANSKVKCLYKMTVYTEISTDRKFVIMVGTGGSRNNDPRNRKYIDDLFKMAFPELVLPKPRFVIKYNSGEGRKPLGRLQVINYLLNLTPPVQVSLTTNSKGNYETSAGMEELGIRICSCCGYPQPIELTICKECGEWLTPPISLSRNKPASVSS